MNAVKTLALVASTIGFANIGLSLPAHSQQVASNQVAQTAIVSGSNNVVSQTNILVINSRGRFNDDNRLRSTTRTTQTAEIQGDSNRINQASDARIDNSYYRSTNDTHSENVHRRHHEGSERHGKNGHHRHCQY